jgi:hypothetical protein
MKYTIFAIDNSHDTGTVKRFLRLVDNYKNMGKIDSKMRHYIGSWRDSVTGRVHLENSYCLLTRDFDSLVVPAGYVDKQDCFMQFSDSNYSSAVLTYADDRPEEYLGLLQEAPAHVAMEKNSWTYDIERGIYFIARPKPYHYYQPSEPYKKLQP